MKRVLSLAAILAGIAIIGCNRIDLVAPALISPADGAALYTPPTFIWTSGEEAEEYVIHVWTGSTDVIEDTLTDTTYTMSDSAFENLSNGTYNWQTGTVVFNGVLLSETRSFIVDKPPPPLDLDTTYFPFGRGYEWRYARHSWQHVSDPFWESWDKYDTFTVTVSDSFWEGDTLFFQFEEVGIYGLSNPVKIWSDQIELFWDTIPLIPEPFTKPTDILWGDGEYKASYGGDTLFFTLRGPGDPYDEGSVTFSSTRMIGVGSISHGRHYNGSSCGVDWDDGFSDRLLYFYNGQDTVYKAD